MVEKIGHIQNPLSVIAIFAALAEVSGTVVLPLLDKDTQHVYIWFLMLFPIFLVAVFFLVLYKKHHVLYAPTDFKDDQTFKELFENASGSAKVEKMNSESDEAVPGDVPPNTESAPDQDVSSISAEETLRRSFQGNGLLAEELVIAKLSKTMGVKFDLNLAVRGQPKLLFDAVSTTNDRAVVAEVRFTRQGVIPEIVQTEYFHRVMRFMETLPEEKRSNIEFVFALVTDTDNNDKIKRMERTLEKMRSIASDYSFKTILLHYKMQDLEREFKVQ